MDMSSLNNRIETLSKLSKDFAIQADKESQGDNMLYHQLLVGEGTPFKDPVKGDVIGKAGSEKLESLRTKYKTFLDNFSRNLNGGNRRRIKKTRRSRRRYSRRK